MSSEANTESFAPGTTNGGHFGTRQLIASLFLVTGLCVAIYFPVAGFDFLVFDDRSYVYQNEDIALGLTVESVRNAFTRPYVSSWHPLAIVSHATDIEFFGLNPGAHHLTSLFWHILNSCFLLLVTQRLIRIPTVSIAVAALFAVHPQHVEPVAWISSRKDLVSTFFLLATVFAYKSYVDRPSILRYSILCINLVLGLLAKPMLVTLPFALLLLDLWPLNRVARLRDTIRLALEKVPLLSICAAFAVATFAVQSEGGAVTTFEQYPVSGRIANMFHAYMKYVGQTFFPIRLAGFYPHTVGTLNPLYVATAATFFFGVTGLAASQYRRRPALTFAWFWFVGMLVPVIGIIQFGAHGMADRYMYVPHIGLFWGLLTCLWTALQGERRTLWFSSISAIAVVACAFVALHQVHVWKNDVTLFRASLKVTPPHATPLTNLGVGLTTAGFHREAIHCFLAARNIGPAPVPQASNDLAVVYARTGHLALAHDLFEEAIRRTPEASSRRMQSNLDGLVKHEELLAARETQLRATLEASGLTPGEYLELADIYNGRADYARAVEFYSFALRIKEFDRRAEILAKRGLAFGRLGHLELGIQDLRETLTLRPEDIATSYDLAKLEAASGDREAAIATLERAIQRFPDRTESSVFRNLLYSEHIKEAAD